MGVGGSGGGAGPCSEGCSSRGDREGAPRSSKMVKVHHHGSEKNKKFLVKSSGIHNRSLEQRPKCG